MRAAGWTRITARTSDPWGRGGPPGRSALGMSDPGVGNAGRRRHGRTGGHRDRGRGHHRRLRGLLPGRGGPLGGGARARGDLRPRRRHALQRRPDHAQRRLPAGLARGAGAGHALAARLGQPVLHCAASPAAAGALAVDVQQSQRQGARRAGDARAARAAALERRPVGRDRGAPGCRVRLRAAWLAVGVPRPAGLGGRRGRGRRGGALRRRLGGLGRRPRARPGTRRGARRVRRDVLFRGRPLRPPAGGRGGRPPGRGQRRRAAYRHRGPRRRDDRAPRHAAAHYTRHARGRHRGAGRRHLVARAGASPAPRPADRTGQGLRPDRATAQPICPNCRSTKWRATSRSRPWATV